MQRKIIMDKLLIDYATKNKIIKGIYGKGIEFGFYPLSFASENDNTGNSSIIDRLCR